MEIKIKSGIIFIRNSDIRYDTRLRKSIDEAGRNGINTYFLGWIRDGSNQPKELQKINERFVSTNYFCLETKFGIGLKNIFKLMRFNIWLIINLISKRKSFDTVYACDLDVAFPSLLMKLFFKKKIIYDIFDFYSHTHNLFPALRKVVEKIEYGVCKIVDIVIVCTEKRADILKKMTGVDAVIIYNTPNLSDEVRDGIKRNNKNVFTVVYVGTLPKTTRLLFEITEKIKLIPDIHLHIAGIGPLEDYFVEVSREFKNIQYYGQITNQAALELQNNSDVLFATYDPSFEINRNSAPNKVYEAMALKKPIIVCKNTDADIVISKNECGYSIEYDANEFMSVVYKYKNNPDLMKNHGENGYKLYQSNYSWLICRSRLSMIFKNTSH